MKIVLSSPEFLRVSQVALDVITEADKVVVDTRIHSSKEEAT